MHTYILALLDAVHDARGGGHRRLVDRLVLVGVAGDPDHDLGLLVLVIVIHIISSIISNRVVVVVVVVVVAAVVPPDDREHVGEVAVDGVRVRHLGSS